MAPLSPCPSMAPLLLPPGAPVLPPAPSPHGCSLPCASSRGSSSSAALLTDPASPLPHRVPSPCLSSLRAATRAAAADCWPVLPPWPGVLLLPASLPHQAAPQPLEQFSLTQDEQQALLPSCFSNRTTAPKVNLGGSFDMEKARNMKLILSAFEQVSGVKINFRKSELFFFGAAQVTAERYTEIFGCKSGDLFSNKLFRHSNTL
ncbi:hypothetical protein U9M48_008262 [Paspalum notatum var. saurae]|uniref:Uncharacterized protein n=1 Tax=Paspalum notatum var. saurae TaxID=547442 RepID=A0AAQ3SP74_PASNO